MRRLGAGATNSRVCVPPSAGSDRPANGRRGAGPRNCKKVVFRMNKLFHEIDLGTSRAVCVDSAAHALYQI